MIWNTFPSSLIFEVFGSCLESRAVDFLARFVKKYLVALLYPLFSDVNGFIISENFLRQ